MSYYGRGAHQLSYNFNYAPFSQVAFGDASVLLNDPDRVAREGWLAISSAIWFYMTPGSPKPSMHDMMVGYWQANASDTASGNRAGFGATTNIINGGIECGKGTETAGSLSRIKYFKALTNAIGGRLGSNLECGAAQAFSAGGSAVVLSYFEQSWDGSKTCQMVSWQTGFSIFIPGSYQRCVEYYFNVTPSVIPDLLGGAATAPTITTIAPIASTTEVVVTPVVITPTITITPAVQTNPIVSSISQERKREIIINLGNGLRASPANFLSQTTFRSKYSYSTRSDGEK